MVPRDRARLKRLESLEALDASAPKPIPFNFISDVDATGGVGTPTITFSQFWTPTGNGTQLTLGLTVTTTSPTDQVRFFMQRNGVDIGPTAHGAGPVVSATLAYIDTARPINVGADYTIGATNLTPGNSVTTAPNEAVLNIVELI